MDRVSNDAFSPSGLYKLVPVKDSLQRFGKQHVGISWIAEATC
jgi:hypothetical protein